MEPLASVVPVAVWVKARGDPQLDKAECVASEMLRLHENLESGDQEYFYDKKRLCSYVLGVRRCLH